MRERFLFVFSGCLAEVKSAFDGSDDGPSRDAI